MKEETNTLTGEQGKKILLLTPPFWSPLIPAQGIASLKGFLQQYGYPVTAVDMTAAVELLEYYREYFETIKEFIPPEKRGNFYNIGHDLLRNHMMAYSNRGDEQEYRQLVKRIIYTTYYCPAAEDYITALTNIVAGFYTRLEEEILALLAREKPAVLGLTVHSGNLPAAYFIFRQARAHHPHIKTVMGGSIFLNHLAEGTPDLEFFLEKTQAFIDTLIIGKGEVLFLKLLRGELPSQRRVYTQADVGEEEGRLYPVGLPDLTDYPLERYLYLSASGSRSCPYNCSFCNVKAFFGPYTKKDAVQAVTEMKQLQQTYGHRLFFMNDSLLNLVITDLAREIINAEMTVYLDGYFIVDDQSAEIENTLLWRQGGFYRARLGVESGSQHVLDMIGKRITPAKTKAALAGLAEAGIKTTTYWVIGHPGETEEDFQQTLQLLEEMRNDIWQAECNPFTYYYRGQGREDDWSGQRKPLYPGKARELLLCQTWVLDCQPSREEIYDRVFRFARHCRQLDIPNPYTLDEIYKADERWKRLHKNAVPPIIDIMNNRFDLLESRKVKKILKLKQKKQDEGEFDF